jgi:hypothetical protein
MVMRIACALLCFGLAWAMHFLWNAPFLEDLFDGGYGEMAVLLIVKGIPVVIAAGLFWRVAARENGTYLHALAAWFVPERELIRDDEWVRLGAPMQRYKVRREMGWTFGWKARRLKTQLQREQLRLIRRAGTYGRGAQTLRHEVAIRRLRAELDPLIGAKA